MDKLRQNGRSWLKADVLRHGFSFGLAQTRHSWMLCSFCAVINGVMLSGVPQPKTIKVERSQDLHKDHIGVIGSRTYHSNYSKGYQLLRRLSCALRSRDRRR
jgi:hypothetical protein